MLKKFLEKMGNFIISPTPYVLGLGISGTLFIYYGVFYTFGEGIAYLVIGLLLLIYTVALIRSVNNG